MAKLKYFFGRFIPLSFGFLILSDLVMARGSDQRSILDSILSRSQSEIYHGSEPIIIFDLDDTIFDAGSRTLAILNDLAKDPAFSGEFSGLAVRLKHLSNDDVHYEFSDNLDMLGIHDPKLREKATQYWSARFFLQCERDAIHTQAQEFVLKAYEQGAHVVYLTGRDEPRMKNCTTESLRAHGLPLGHRASLMLKPTKEIPDVEFKESAFRTIEKLGVVVAGFDNEPANVNIMQKKFPAAEIIFIETRHSNRPEQPYPTITRYRWEK